jgi:hypothetical protein
MSFLKSVLMNEYNMFMTTPTYKIKFNSQRFCKQPLLERGTRLAKKSNCAGRCSRDSKRELYFNLLENCIDPLIIEFNNNS